MQNTEISCEGQRSAAAKDLASCISLLAGVVTSCFRDPVPRDRQEHTPRQPDD